MGGTVRAEMMITAASPLTVLGLASVSKQLNGHCWNRQHEGDQDCSEVEHKLLRSSSAISRGKVNLSKRPARFPTPANGLRRRQVSYRSESLSNAVFDQPLLHPRHNGTTTVPSGRSTTKNICRIGPLMVSEKQTSQNGTGCDLNSCVSKAPTCTW